MIMALIFEHEFVSGKHLIVDIRTTRPTAQGVLQSLIVAQA